MLLSVGLIPYNPLLEKIGVKMHSKTRGPIVDESYQTSVKGIFACGNSLHVHDLVDFVSEEAETAGNSAAEYITGTSEEKINVEIKPDGKIRYTVPQTITGKKDVTVYFRVADVFRNVKVNVYSGEELIYSKKKAKVAPGEMESIKIKKELLENCDELAFKLEEA